MPEVAIIAGWCVRDELCDIYPSTVHHVGIVSASRHADTQTSCRTLHTTNNTVIYLIKCFTGVACGICIIN